MVSSQRTKKYDLRTAAVTPVRPSQTSKSGSPPAAKKEAMPKNMYQVDRILDERYNAKEKRHEFFLKWEGFDESHNSWEPEENLKCPELIAEFRKEKQKTSSAGKETETPAKRKEMIPAKQKVSTPAKQKVSTPAKGKAATPAKYKTATPAKLKSAMPAKPKAATPAKPKTATPAKPKVSPRKRYRTSSTSSGEAKKSPKKPRTSSFTEVSPRQGAASAQAAKPTGRTRRPSTSGYDEIPVPAEGESLMEQGVKPLEIIGNCRGAGIAPFDYIVKYSNKKTERVPATVCNKMHPKLVIDFFVQSAGHA